MLSFTILMPMILTVASATSHRPEFRHGQRHSHIRSTTMVPTTVEVTAASSSISLLDNRARRIPDNSADLSTNHNGIMLQGFEWYVRKDEGHWNRLNSQLDKLASIGIDRIWIPPATKAGANPSTGYDVFDLWDLGEFNQKGHVATSYGTKDELLALSKNATGVGISLLADAVLNQRSGADTATACQAHKVDPTNRLESISDTQQIQAWVDFQFSGRGKKYSNKTWGCDDFSAVDYDESSKVNAIWKIDGQDNAFATDVSTENGNYDYLVLADVAYANPSVQEDVKAWGSWVVQELSLSGFRLDAAKHMSRAFLSDWVSDVICKVAKSDLFIVAEYLTGDIDIVQDFVGGFEDQINVFDTPLQTKFHYFSTGEQTDLRTALNNTWLSTRPQQAVTYVMNHDTQAGQALSSLNVSGWFMPLAYALILLREAGYPTIFYGDIYGEFDGTGNFTKPPYATQIVDLARARKYFAYGTQTDYFDTASEIGWTRQGNDAHPDGLAVVMSNAQGGTSNLTMNVGIGHAGETWSSLFGGSGAVVVDDDGNAVFIAGAGTVNVYTRANATQRGEFGIWDISI